MENNSTTEPEEFLQNLEQDKSTVLERLFEQQINESGMSERAAISLLETSYRPLHAILRGSQKQVDFLLLHKIADFLQIPFDQVVELYLGELLLNFKEEFTNWNKKKFILENFDLKNLYKCGFLENTSDFKYIEDRINQYFGLNDITEFGKDSIDVLFSSGKPKPKKKLTKEFWAQSAQKNLKIINYNEYDRANLLKYIPSIRWQTLNEKKGLFQVIRDLFELGLTGIFEPHINDLHVRGATFFIDGKPGIALTNYTRYYPSLWFALLHELHHVLFDWDKIKRDKRHISGEIDLFSMSEVKADNFARSFFLPKEKTDEVFPFINNPAYVKEYAKANYIHPSLIYIFYCWEKGDSNNKAWSRYDAYLPSYTEAVQSLTVLPWQSRRSIREVIKQREEGVFKGL